MIAVKLCLGLLFFVLEHQCRVVTPHENCTNNVCYFDFVVDYKFTMMWYNYTNPREPQFQPVVIRDGILQRRVTNVACREQYIPLTREGTINDYSRVIHFSKVCKNLNVASFFLPQSRPQQIIQILIAKINRGKPVYIWSIAK